jgi:hypothetical protein
MVLQEVSPTREEVEALLLRWAEEDEEKDFEELRKRASEDPAWRACVLAVGLEGSNTTLQIAAMDLLLNLRKLPGGQEDLVTLIRSFAKSSEQEIRFAAVAGAGWLSRTKKELLAPEIRDLATTPRLERAVRAFSLSLHERGAPRARKTSAGE